MGTLKSVFFAVLIAAGFSATGLYLNQITGPEVDSEGSGDAFESDEVQEEFVVLLNDFRERNGLRPVETDGEVQQLASSHSADMAAHSYSGHEDSEGRSFSERYRRAGIPDCAGENVAQTWVNQQVDVDWAEGGEFAAYNEEELAEMLFRMWKNSEGHRKIMLSKNTDEIGLGINRTESDKVYATLNMC